MPNRAIDYNSITEPLGQSMSMVAQHMLRQPQIRYRLDMEARKLANDTMVSRAQAGNYDAQARGHTAKAVGDEQRNGAFERLNSGGGIAKLHGMIAGTMPFNATEYDQAMSDMTQAFGVSGRDAIDLIKQGAQAAAAKNGVPARANAEATGNITQIANNDADNTAMAARGYSLGPGSRRYNSDGTMQVENPSAASQNRQFPEEVQKWMNAAQAEHAKAIAEDDIPKATRIAASVEATRKKWATPASNFNTITAPAANQAQDPDDSEMPEETEMPAQPAAAGTNAPAGAGPKAVNVEAIMAEANRAIQAGAPRAAVLKELQEKYGITVK